MQAIKLVEHVLAPGQREVPTRQQVRPVCRQGRPVVGLLLRPDLPPAPLPPGHVVDAAGLHELAYYVQPREPAALRSHRIRESAAGHAASPSQNLKGRVTCPQLELPQVGDEIPHILGRRRIW
jgi:hypothetical protein